MIEVLIALPIMGLLALAFFSLSAKVYKAERSVQRSYDATLYMNGLQKRFIEKDFCTTNLNTGIPKLNAKTTNNVIAIDRIVDANGDILIKKNDVQKFTKIKLKNVTFQTQELVDLNDTVINGQVDLDFEVNNEGNKTEKIKKTSYVSFNILSNGEAVDCVGARDNRAVAFRAYACQSLEGNYDYNTHVCNLDTSPMIVPEICRVYGMNMIDGKCYAP